MLYVGTGGVADRHAHHAIQLVWGLDHPVELHVRQQSFRTTATIIPAGVDHGFDAYGGRIALVLVDAQGRRGSRLAQAARQLAGRDIADQLAGLCPPAADLTADQAVAWCDNVLNRLGWPGHPPAVASATRQAVRYLEATIPAKPTLADTAAFAHVSPSWLTHTLSRQVGIPFRRLVRWLRIKRAIQELRCGAPLTEAAVRAGFSDSAHLSRVFRAHFGITPSAAVRQMTFAGDLWDTYDPA